ncbi:hypothetical protein ABPG77_000874 [Micractinium sp. CCAP 211/92]
MPLALATPLAAVGRRQAFRGTAVQARPAVPPRRRSARAAAQPVSARAAASKQAYICVDCGYIYDGSDGAFDKLPNSYRCPVCNAPKRRFKPYAGGSGRNDAKSMNARWEAMQKGSSGAAAKEGSNAGLLAGLGVGVVGLVALYAYLSSQYN